MSKFIDFTFESSTKRNTIHALKCVPEGEIKGIVQIAHGIAEHIDRYQDFMEFLADHGYLAVGNDHLGHGKSIRDERERGIFSEDDGWFKVVEDMCSLHDLMKKEHGDLRYILFGHSMGSFLVRTYIARYGDRFDAAIISGTGHQGRLMVNMGNIIADRTVKKKGYASDGESLAKLTMGGYLKRIEHPRTDCDWLSRDDAMVDRYVSDPMCGFTAKAGLYMDMLHGVKFVTDESNIRRIPKDRPIYFISGREDPVGEYGRGVERACKSFRSAGIEDVTMKLYDGGRHEMLNEINREEVYLDILGWLDARAK